MSMDPGRDFKAGERASRGRAAEGAAAREAEREQGRAASTGARSRGCGPRERAHRALKAAVLGCRLGGVSKPGSPRARPATLRARLRQFGGWGRLRPGLGERKEGGCLLELASVCQIPVLRALKDTELCAGLTRGLPSVRVARRSRACGEGGLLRV